MLKPCPCGAVPDHLTIEDGATCKYAWASGSCCGEWSVEFRTNYETNNEKLQHLAAAEWNTAARLVSNTRPIESALTARAETAEAERDEAVSAVRGARRYTEEMASRIPDLGDDEDYRGAVSRVVRERDEARAKIAAVGKAWSYAEGLLVASGDLPIELVNKAIDAMDAALSDAPALAVVEGHLWFDGEASKQVASIEARLPGYAADWPEDRDYIVVVLGAGRGGA